MPSAKKPTKFDSIDENAINIYTDGSSYSHPRLGGIGVRFVTVGSNGKEVIEDHDPLGYRGANNQQMELKACSEALQLLIRGRTAIDKALFRKIIIKTDSRYVVDNYYSARFVWPRERWATKDGTPVANADIWKELTRRAHSIGMRVDIEWVKGHKSSVHNKAVDKLAKQSAKQAFNEPLSVVGVRRKLTDKSVVRGSVVMEGQRLTIRIVTDEYLRLQKCWKYKYEVVSKASVFRGNVDMIYSKIQLRAGHTYHVRVNSDPKNPQVVRLFHEVEKVVDIPTA